MFVPSVALSQDLYSEPLRPQYHFTAKAGWLNDPNGLSFFKGEYHMFFQHNPSGTGWGNMTWGHAVSKDLVHWKQIENAIEPDALGTEFSGSAVVDNGVLKLLYTAAGGTNDASKGKPFSQCLATSEDGRVFSKFASNPVLNHIEAENRDPKVVWYKPTKSWVMALYLSDDRYALFGSADLTTWTKLSDVKMPGTGECPDFYELPLGSQKYWVFSGANGNYRLGTFDGTTFRPVTEVIPSNFGKNSYAAQTFFNDPKGRRIQIAWMQGSDFVGTAWNQQMSVPRRLTLRSTALGPRLATEPVDELKSLRARRVKATSGHSFESASTELEVRAEFRVPANATMTMTVNGVPIRYDSKACELTVLGSKAMISPIEGKLELTVFSDRASLEVFAQNGLVSMPFFRLADPKTTGVLIDGLAPSRCEVFELKSTWSQG